MQFDNPMVTFDPDTTASDATEAVDLDQGTEASDVNLQEQLRAELESNLNVRSFLHGTFYTVLLIVLIVLFLEVEFDIMGPDRINALMAFVLVLGGVSTFVKSRMDDKAYDPNYVSSPIWRFIVFIFVVIGEILLFTMARDLVAFLPIEALGVLAFLVGAVNLAVLWQFTEEEFDDYIDPPSDVRTVVSNYIAMLVLSVVVFLVLDNVPQIEPITNALSIFLFVFYGGFFWTYAFYDRESINTVSRIVLSVMISLMLLQMALLLLDRLTIPINATVIIVTNFVLCTLGFMTYNARPRIQTWLEMT